MTRYKTRRVCVRFSEEQVERYTALFGTVYGVHSWTELVHKSLHEFWTYVQEKRSAIQSPAGFRTITNGTAGGTSDGGQSMPPSPSARAAKAAPKSRAGIKPKANTGRRLPVIPKKGKKHGSA